MLINHLLSFKFWEDAVAPEETIVHWNRVLESLRLGIINDIKLGHSRLDSTSVEEVEAKVISSSAAVFFVNDEGVIHRVAGWKRDSRNIVSVGTYRIEVQEELEVLALFKAEGVNDAFVGSKCHERDSFEVTSTSGIGKSIINRLFLI